MLNRNKEIVIFIEMKLPEGFHSDELKKAAKYQELDVAKKQGQKYMLFPMVVHLYGLILKRANIF